MANQDDYANLVSQFNVLSKNEIEFNNNVNRIFKDFIRLESNRRCITAQRLFLQDCTLTTPYFSIITPYYFLFIP